MTKIATCSHCGGSNILFDAVAKWMPEYGEYMIDIHDSSNCEDCGGECRVNWREVETPIITSDPATIDGRNRAKLEG
jgi:hypothetical protein